MQNNQRGVRKKIAIVCCLFVLTLAALLSLTGCGDRPGTVEGTVTKATDGQPLAHAEVSAFSLSEVEDAGDISIYTRIVAIQSATPDASSAFSFILDPGRYEIEAQAEGFKPSNRLIEVKAGRTVRVDLRLDTLTP